MVFSTIFSKNGNFIFRIAITGGQKIEVGQNFLFFYFLICLLVLGKIKQTALSQDKICKKQSQLFFPTNFRMVVPRFKEGEMSDTRVVQISNSKIRPTSSMGYDQTAAKTSLENPGNRVFSSSRYFKHILFLSNFF